LIDEEQVRHFLNFFQAIQLREKDQRMKVMNEILNGIKILKLYAWENSFADKVEMVRNREVSG
jgi:hypothetical protein